MPRYFPIDGMILVGHEKLTCRILSIALSGSLQDGGRKCSVSYHTTSILSFIYDGRATTHRIYFAVLGDIFNIFFWGGWLVLTLAETGCILIFPQD